MEGYNDSAGIKRIEIIRSGAGGDMLSSEDVIAYISDMRLDTDKPIYKPDDISGIISFIEKLIRC